MNDKVRVRCIAIPLLEREFRVTPVHPETTLLQQIPSVGWSRGGEESGAEVSWARRGGGTFERSARSQIPTVREQRSHRDATAAPRAARQSLPRTRENAAAFGDRRRREIGIDKHWRRGMSRARGQVGPTIFVDPPRQHPILSCNKFPPWGGPGVSREIGLSVPTSHSLEAGLRSAPGSLYSLQIMGTDVT